MVLHTFERMPGKFTMQEPALACQGVSQPMLKKVLKSLEAEGKVRLVSRDPQERLVAGLVERARKENVLLWDIGEVEAIVSNQR